MDLKQLTQEHWHEVEAIYLAGIATGNATFTTSAPSWDEWDKGHLTHSRAWSRWMKRARYWDGQR